MFWFCVPAKNPDVNTLHLRLPYPTAEYLETVLDNAIGTNYTMHKQSEDKVSSTAEPTLAPQVQCLASLITSIK